ncbi:2,5-diketo-D-gluconate reductase A [Raineyella antarctica]|uniref:2,5-diketo-D-gluconate reductase A n=1 Tax=Raineyella antarctica TaxID=1577474 RepID=A0A1G6HX30_9ACTN|nr:aldo/keto reductase [Raineyella antarctica]SDB98713.1 2,5-diketo-D-gluconate reductase A [Raineyella antarctica]
MTTNLAPTVPLLGGGRMPLLGLGTWPMTGAECTEAVATAIDAGYRLVDTAENYENEAAVGAGVLQASVPREEVFVTTKFNQKWHGRDLVTQALEAALERMGLDYVDLCLVHWPNPGHGRYVEAFEGLLAAQQAGLTRSVGTSNYTAEFLEALFDAGYVPEVNQIELDPTRPRRDLQAIHREKGIVTEAWSPLGRYHRDDLMAAPAVADAARELDRTPAQIVLRWEVQQDIVAVPKSADPARQVENLSLFDFELSAEQMAAIDALADPNADIVSPLEFGH